MVALKLRQVGKSGPNQKFPSYSPSHAQIAVQQRVQEEMKEENKKKKELVEKALRERYSLSQQESLHLKKIQSELASLDELVTRDVAVLREKIEAANRLHDAARLVWDTGHHWVSRGVA